MLTLNEINQLLNCHYAGENLQINSVSTDSRTLQPGALFFAIKGDYFDGHEFIESARKAGAVAAVVSREIKTTLPLFKVDDTRIALGKCAALWRERFNMPVIALTGSMGKTTVKEMIAAILRQQGEVHATQGTLNNDIGLPLTLFQLRSHHQYAVIELGANHIGEIDYLSRLTKPTIALITNVAACHLEGFGSLEGVAQAKSEIFLGLEKNGRAIINSDDKFAEFFRKKLLGKEIITFGWNEMADVRAKLLSEDPLQLHFLLQTPVGDTEINLPLLGKHNITNAIAAAATALQAGANLAAVKAGLEAMIPVKGRLVLKAGYNQARIIDDTYNANPTAVRAAMEILSNYSGRRIMVLGDMGELGPDAARFHQELGEIAKGLKLDALYTYGPLSHITANEFGKQAFAFNEQADLIAALKPQLNPKTTVLVKGSRSMKMERVVNGICEG